MNINSAESCKSDGSQTLQTCSALCLSGLPGACLSDAKLKTVARAEEECVPVSAAAGTASVPALAAEFGGAGVEKTSSTLRRSMRPGAPQQGCSPGSWEEALHWPC